PLEGQMSSRLCFMLRRGFGPILFRRCPLGSKAACVSVGVLNDEAADRMRGARGEIQPYRRSKVVQIEVERFDGQACEQVVNGVCKTRKGGTLHRFRASEPG